MTHEELAQLLTEAKRHLKRVASQSTVAEESAAKYDLVHRLEAAAASLRSAEATSPDFPKLGAITRSEPIQAYGVRHCRGHWHVTRCGEDLQGDGIATQYETIDAALDAADKCNADWYQPASPSADAGEKTHDIMAWWIRGTGPRDGREPTVVFTKAEAERYGANAWPLYLHPAPPETRPADSERSERRQYTEAEIVAHNGDPVWEAIWGAIKGWDISRTSNGLYGSPTGDDATVIYDAIQSARSAQEKTDGE